MEIGLVFLLISCAVMAPAPAGPAAGFDTRSDGAVRITDALSESCQNPVFSPDSREILFTRFTNGYNRGPSELVRVWLDGTRETVIIPASGSDNVNVPYGSWVAGKICWSSDRGGGTEEIYLADEDGSNIERLTDHPGPTVSYIEPVFNPANPEKIVFEYVPSDTAPHRIGLLEMDEGGRVTLLTDSTSYDDRLPSWSRDGARILFQRNSVAGTENWEIYTAVITLADPPYLSGYRNITGVTSQDTDNSWAYQDRRVLSSSDYGNLQLPNIFAFSSRGVGRPIRITFSGTYEDGAPSYSPDGRWIAFESHSTADEDSPSAIWIIPARPENIFLTTGRTDLNGDGTPDLTIFRPDRGLWAVRGITRVYFGGGEDLPRPGDYTGDGTDGMGIFRPGSGLWAARDVSRFYFGSISDQPILRDYNGDGTDDPAIFRWSTGLWAVRGITRFYFGGADDQPVPGDFTGSGARLAGIFRGETGLWAIRGVTRFYFGRGSDGAFPGDYNGDTTGEAALYRPVSGLWAVRGLTRVYFGGGLDLPAPADYRGNGSDDIGIFRGSSGLWAAQGVTRVYFGGSSDIPVVR